MVRSQKFDPNVHQDTIGKLFSAAFYWCHKNMVVPVEKHTIIIFKVLNNAGSVVFGSAQTR
jgi:hypothetical protein